MAGMYGLGRTNNFIPIAAGVGVSLIGASAIGFLCTGNDTFTLTLATSFAGSYSQPANWNPITLKWTNASTNGTAAWVQATQSASNAVTIASNTVWFELLVSQVPDTYNYVKCSVAASGLVTVVTHDLTIQRAPANLAKLSA
jgi:hypothetical protein